MADQFRNVAAIVRGEFVHSWRDRSTLILVFLMPLALAGVTTFAFSGLGTAGAASIALVDDDHGAVARVLADDVLPGLANPITGSSGGTPLIKIKDYPTADEARRAVRRGTVSAAILVPSGFTAAVQASRPSEVTLVTGASTSLGPAVATSVLDGFSAQIGTNALSIRLVGSGAGAAAVTPLVVSAANAQRSPVTVTTALAGRGTVTAGSFFAPSMVVLALFFCGQMLGRGLVAERRSRTLARMVLAGVAPPSILGAKYLTALLTGLLSTAVVLGLFAGFGTRFGSVWGLLLLSLLSATAMVSASSLAVLLARDEEQAGTLGTVAVFVLAILGGNFVPLSQSHGTLGTLALCTPNGWAIRAFADLSVAAPGQVLSTIGTTLLVLLAFTVVLGAPALLLSRRVVARAGV